MDGKKAPPANVTQADMSSCPNADLVGMFKEISDYYFQTPGMDQSRFPGQTQRQPGVQSLSTNTTDTTDTTDSRCHIDSETVDVLIPT